MTKTTKIVATLIVICLLAATGITGNLFIHDYTLAIAEKAHLTVMVNTVNRYTDMISTLDSSMHKPIDNEEFTDFDEEIITLAQNSRLNILNLSRESHILHQSEQTVDCHLTLEGNISDLENFLSRLQRRKELISITDTKIEFAPDGMAIADLDYTVYLK